MMLSVIVRRILMAEIERMLLASPRLLIATNLGYPLSGDATFASMESTPGVLVPRTTGTIANGYGLSYNGFAGWHRQVAP